MPDILVSQNIETQTVIDNEIVVQVAQDTQEQVVIGVQGPVGPVGPQGPPGPGDMLKGTYDTDADGVVDAAESVPWSGVTSKPDTFTPAAHTHTKSQITDFPASLPASDVYAWAKAATKPAYTYSEVGAAAADHTHALDSASITGNLSSLRVASPTYVTGSAPALSVPLFDLLRADRLAFLPASQIIIEKSTDAGVTWQDAGVSDTNKVGLFAGAWPYLEIPLLNGIRSTNCMLRVTITAQRYNVPVGTAETDKYNYWATAYYLSQERYTRLTDAWLWVSAIYDRIQCVIQSAPASDPWYWSTLCTAYLSGWAGGNYASFDAIFGGAQSQTSQPWNMRFIFRTCSATNTLNDADLSSNNNQAQYIHQIKATGQSVWAYSNQLMFNDHLYAWDVDKNATFPAKVTGTQLVSSVASGTAPLVVTSPTVVPNLNADTLDGNHASAFAPATQSINAQTGATYTFVIGDAGKLVTFGSASDTTVTIPTNASVAFPTGTRIDCLQVGSGKVTFGGADVTINSKSGNKAIGAQWVMVTLIKTGTDTWSLLGDLIA